MIKKYAICKHFPPPNFCQNKCRTDETIQLFLQILLLQISQSSPLVFPLIVDDLLSLASHASLGVEVLIQRPVGNHKMNIPDGSDDIPDQQEEEVRLISQPLELVLSDDSKVDNTSKFKYRTNSQDNTEESGRPCAVAKCSNEQDD